jgi:hypothetical protein
MSPSLTRQVSAIAIEERKDRSPSRTRLGSPVVNVAMTHATMSWSMVVRALAGPRR